MAKLTFLGTGGGRFVTITQMFSTGGWILEMDDQKISVDPGPGAILRAKEVGFDPKKLTGVIVSHEHLDNYNDASVMIEAMTFGAKKKRGFFISNRTVIEGDKNEPAKIAKYHLNVLEEFHIVKAGDNVKVGSIEIYATETKHRTPGSLGFVFSGTEKIGYTGDGEYYEGQEKHFRNCKCIVINCMRPREDNWPGHMNALMAKELIERAKPKIAVLSGLGMKLAFGKANSEAEWITRQTGIETIAAKDGMVLDLNEKLKGLDKFL